MKDCQKRWGMKLKSIILTVTWNLYHNDEEEKFFKLEGDVSKDSEN